MQAHKILEVCPLRVPVNGIESVWNVTVQTNYHVPVIPQQFNAGDSVRYNGRDYVVIDCAARFQVGHPRWHNHYRLAQMKHTQRGSAITRKQSTTRRRPSARLMFMNIVSVPEFALLCENPRVPPQELVLFLMSAATIARVG